MDEKKYDDLIKKIKRKRKWVIALTIVAVILVLFFATPFHVEVMGEKVVDYKGMHPILTALLVILCLFIEVMVYAIVSLPLHASMDQECDPEKHLILNLNLSKQKNIDQVYVVDYFYLGNYNESIKYANKMIQSSNEQAVLAGLFNKARCEFFLKDYQALKQTSMQFKHKLLSCQKIKSYVRVACQKINYILDFMSAIGENDVEKISELRSFIEVWNSSKPTAGFVNYLKGIAAYNMKDSEEAIYRFKLVKENCSKMVLSKLSEEYLLLLK